MANVHGIRDGRVGLDGARVFARIERIRLVCGIDYAFTDASPPVTLRVWIDDLVV